MTVSTVVNHEQYDGNGTTTSFPYRFRVLKSEHMVVTVSDPEGRLSTLTLGMDYDLSGVGMVNGGNVILKSLYKMAGKFLSIVTCRLFRKLTSEIRGGSLPKHMKMHLTI